MKHNYKTIRFLTFGVLAVIVLNNAQPNPQWQYCSYKATVRDSVGVLRIQFNVKGIYSPWSSKSRFDKKIYIVRYGNKMSSKEEDSELFFRWLK
ncbi:hypothetical protein T03_8666 [Trichinella britovi]|uniref:Secreted protein n=1 Tax=Trichinella britovi TaxID=45882 RepID=A0A0V1DBP8_TRIBR|nr:hypothetical protein T03_8666 [Trichinella britovi]